MHPRLVLIAGAPGVGKSEAASRLAAKLADCAWLDGDDVWRIHPFRVDPETVRLAEHNIASVLGNFLSGGFSHVILSWVLHRQAIIDRILGALDVTSFDVAVFTLLCDEDTLERRWRRSHPGEDIGELPFRRLRDSTTLESIKVDTTELDPEQIADHLHKRITGDAVPWRRYPRRDRTDRGRT